MNLDFDQSLLFLSDSKASEPRAGARETSSREETRHAEGNNFLARGSRPTSPKKNKGVLVICMN